MSYAAPISATYPLPIVDFTLAETTHVLHRVGVAGMFGLGAGPLFLTRRPKPKRPPTWRMSLLGSTALASVSLPFLCMERLSYHCIMSTEDSRSPHNMQYALYVSHTLGTVLGAGILHTVRKPKGRFHVPFQVLAPMLCKAQLEMILLKNERY